MEITENVWPYVLVLASVINGLGIVRLLGGLGEYLRTYKTHNIQHYWVYSLLILYQLLLHLLFWWGIIGFHEIDSIYFLSYLYVLLGPTLLMLGTSLVIPDMKEDSFNLRATYFGFHKTYFSILAAFCIWAIFLWPVLGYPFSPTAPLLAVILLIALTLRMTDNPKVHATLMVANLAVYICFIAVFAMRVGELGRIVTE